MMPETLKKNVFNYLIWVCGDVDVVMGWWGVVRHYRVESGVESWCCYDITSVGCPVTADLAIRQHYSFIRLLSITTIHHGRGQNPVLWYSWQSSQQGKLETKIIQLILTDPMERISTYYASDQRSSSLLRHLGFRSTSFSASERRTRPPRVSRSSVWPSPTCARWRTRWSWRRRSLVKSTARPGLGLTQSTYCSSNNNYSYNTTNSNRIWSPSAVWFPINNYVKLNSYNHFIIHELL